MLRSVEVDFDLSLHEIIDQLGLHEVRRSRVPQIPDLTFSPGGVEQVELGLWQYPEGLGKNLLEVTVRIQTDGFRSANVVEHLFWCAGAGAHRKVTSLGTTFPFDTGDRFLSSICQNITLSRASHVLFTWPADPIFLVAPKQKTFSRINLL